MIRAAAIDLAPDNGVRVFDVITGTGGADTLTGTSGDDSISGLKGDDVINAGDGNDLVDAGKGLDSVDAGAGDDTVWGGVGVDTIFGGEGDDLIYGGSPSKQTSNDFIDAGTGNDTVYCTASSTVYGGAGDDTIIASNQTSFAGTIDGGDGNDIISIDRGGFDAPWLLVGGAGDDRLSGRSGDETLDGGSGGDRLSGGHGRDTFRYQAATDSATDATDLITHLQKADRIDLSAIDADTTTDGDQSFALVGAFDGHAGELVLTHSDSSSLTLLEGDIDGDGVADLVMRIHGDHTDFTNFAL